MCKTNVDFTCVFLTKFDVVLDSGVIQVFRGTDRSSRFPVGGRGGGGGRAFSLGTFFNIEVLF